MNYNILRFTFFAAVLFAFATSAHAQATGSDCSQSDQPTKTWNQQPPDPLCPNPGYTTDVGFTVYSSTVDTCTDLISGAVYDQSVRQVTGNGIWHCSNFTSQNAKCNPTITQQVTHALSSTDYNRFYLRAWDAPPTMQWGATVCPDPQTYPMARQDFWQCLGRACPTGPPPGVCTGGCWPNPYGGCTCSPIILDIDGKGFYLTDAKSGVMFDISGTGHPVQTAWTASGSTNALLALPGANGLVHNGKELFGSSTPQPASTTPNGFAALAVYDDPKNGGNGDGIIDSRDAVFALLRLWIDANHDGVSQLEELHTLPSLNVTSISLNYKESRKTDQYGNVFRYWSRVNGEQSQDVGQKAYDVFLVQLAPSPTPTAKNTLNPTVPGTAKHIPAGKCPVPNNKVGMLAPTPTALR